MQLPEQSNPGGKWQLWDYRTLYLRTPAPGAVGGTMQVALPVVPDNELWMVDRLTVSSTSTTRTRVRLYDGVAELPRVVEGNSLSGNFDVADMSSALQLQPTTVLLFVWESGASDGAIGYVRAQWTILRQVSQI